MITPELLGYIRAEIAKGKTREEVRGVLLSSGGWTEDDLSEAFRTVIPMQGVVSSNPVVQARQEEKKPTENVSSTPYTPSTPLTSPSPSSISFSSSPLRPFPAPAAYTPSPSLLKPTLLSKSSSSSSSSPSSLSSSPSSHSSFPLLKLIIILIIIGGLGATWWLRPLLVKNVWNSLIKNATELPSFFSAKTNTVPTAPVAAQNNTSIIKTENTPKNCGISAIPKLGVPSSYEDNSVLLCLGENAVSCGNAKGILKDDFFPTIFEIEKIQNSCNFKLSYPADSVLTDITGKSLAGQYILCPINIVKAIDNTKPSAPKLNSVDKTDLSKYGSDIYLYGTLGLFVENNLDANKIQALGCSGAYIQSVIASYAAKKTQ